MMMIDRRTLLTAITGAVAAPVASAVAPVPAVTDRPPDKPVKPNKATDPTIPVPPAPAPETIALWPGPAPGSPPPPSLPAPDLAKVGRPGGKEYRLRGVAAPAMFAYRPQTPNGVALLVMPGGGYSYLSVENEGSAVARLFVASGYTVFVLGYRLPREGWTNRADAPVQDAQRALRLIRAHAKDYAIDPARIGVLGFSAGGHLAASLVTGHGEKLYDPVDAADAKPAKPGFAGLLYAVTTLRAPEDHSASRTNLLGADPSPPLIDRRSPLLHVTAGMPPCFLVHALDDKTVDPACTIDWVTACRAVGVPVEAHLIERGGHGFGVHLPAANPGSRWPDLFQLWAARHGG